MHPYINIATKAARIAADIINSELNRNNDFSVNYKGPSDVVTSIDAKCEESIIKTIKKAYPQHGIIAEETSNEIIENTNDVVWIIDPIDGTFNFAHGNTNHCISIAVMVKQEIEHAVIYVPSTHELFQASKGRGAQLNNRRIRVKKCTTLKDSLLSTNPPTRQRHKYPQYQKLFSNLFLEQHVVFRISGSAALDLANVAAGRLDGFLQQDLRLWDIAAGQLLVKEAGGLISDYKENSNYLNSGNIIATAPGIHSKILDVARITE